MLRALRNGLVTLRGGPSPAQGASLPLSLTQLATLLGRVDTLERALAQLREHEATRNAEHAAQLDALSRLYKRVAARIAREGTPDEPSESVMSLRSRLGR